MKPQPTKVLPQESLLSTHSLESTHSHTNSPDPSLPPVPDSLGRFEIIRVLGSGSYGIVYHARDPVLEREVAIKVPRNYEAWSTAQLQAFISEARSLARLQHENIVSVYDAGQTKDGTPYIVLEYVDGGALSHVDTRSLTRDAILRLLSQIALGLHHAHKRGFVHRDLKPGNVLVARDGRAKISDFGLAIHDDDAASHRNEFAGTIAYMSPEQIQKKAHLLDGRTDLWSFGIIAYQTLARSKPFKADSKDEYCEQVLQRHPKPLSQIDESIPKHVEKICMQCLEKDVRNRPANALEVYEALSSAKPSRKPLLAALLLVLLIPAVAWAITGMWNDSPEADATALSPPPETVEPFKPQKLVWESEEAEDFFGYQSNGVFGVHAKSCEALFTTRTIETDNYDYEVAFRVENEWTQGGMLLGLVQTSTLPDRRQCYVLLIRQVVRTGERQVCLARYHLEKLPSLGYAVDTRKIFDRVTVSGHEEFVIHATVRDGVLQTLTINENQIQFDDPEFQATPLGFGSQVGFYAFGGQTDFTTLLFEDQQHE